MGLTFEYEGSERYGIHDLVETQRFEGWDNHPLFQLVKTASNDDVHIPNLDVILWSQQRDLDFNQIWRVSYDKWNTPFVVWDFPSKQLAMEFKLTFG